MDLVALKDVINQYINTKYGDERITGADNNMVLLTMVDSILEIAGTGFGGDLSPTDNPGTQTNPIYFMAAAKGIYTYCGGITVGSTPAFVIWNGSAWSVKEFAQPNTAESTDKCQGLVFAGDVAPAGKAVNDWYVFLGGGTLSWPGASKTKPGIVYLKSTVGGVDNWDITVFDAQLEFTQAERDKLAAILGTNTGDETAATILSKIGSGNKILSTYLPSYVDDVIEGIYYPPVGEVPAYFQVDGVTITPEQGKIYISTDTNTQYRYTGTAYQCISNPLDYPTQAEAEAGTNNTKVMTPLRTLQQWVYNVANTTIAALSTQSKTIVGAINELLSGKMDKNTVHRTIPFNNAASILCRDYFKASSSITEIILSGASAIEYSTDNITFTAIALPLVAAITVNGNVWWRITFANGQTTATVTINGILS